MNATRDGAAAVSARPVLVAVGAGLIAAGTFTQVTELRSDLMLLWFTAAAVIGFSAVRVAQSGKPLDPYGFMLVYSTLTLAVGTLIGVQTNFSNGFLRPELVTERVVYVEIAFIAGLFLGTLMFTKRKQVVPPRDSERGRHSPFLIAAGSLLIVAAMGYRLIVLVTQGARSWNADRALSFAGQLEVFASVIPLAGVCLLLIGDHRRHRTVISPFSLTILAVWACSSLAIGTRDEVIAPALVLMWAYARRGGRLPFFRLMVIAVSGFALLAIVGTWRTGAAAEGGAAETFVRPVASGVNTTGLIAERVPAYADHVHGETYLGALRYAVPLYSPPVSGPQDLPGALRFPQEIGYSGSSGLGFSPVAEAYWNFGLLGTGAVAVLVGAAMNITNSFSSGYPTRVIHLLYPIAMARTPIAMRSDFLQQYKGILIVVVVVGIALLISNLVDQGSSQVHEVESQ